MPQVDAVAELSFSPVECPGQVISGSDRRVNKNQLLIFKETGWFRSIGSSNPIANWLFPTPSTLFVHNAFEKGNADVDLVISKSVYECDALIRRARFLGRDSYKAYFLDAITSQNQNIRIGILSKIDLDLDHSNYATIDPGSFSPCGDSYFFKLNINDSPIYIIEFNLDSLSKSEIDCDDFGAQIASHMNLIERFSVLQNSLIFVEIDSRRPAWKFLNDRVERRNHVNQVLTAVSISGDETSRSGVAFTWDEESLLSPLLTSSKFSGTVESIEYFYKSSIENITSIEELLWRLDGMLVTLNVRGNDSSTTQEHKQVRLNHTFIILLSILAIMALMLRFR